MNGSATPSTRTLRVSPGCTRGPQVFGHIDAREGTGCCPAAPRSWCPARGRSPSWYSTLSTMPCNRRDDVGARQVQLGGPGPGPVAAASAASACCSSSTVVPLSSSSSASMRRLFARDGGLVRGLVAVQLSLAGQTAFENLPGPFEIGQRVDALRPGEPRGWPGPRGSSPRAARASAQPGGRPPGRAARPVAPAEPAARAGSWVSTGSPAVTGLAVARPGWRRWARCSRLSARSGRVPASPPCKCLRLAVTGREQQAPNARSRAGRCAVVHVAKPSRRSNSMCSSSRLRPSAVVRDAQRGSGQVTGDEWKGTQ